MSDNRHSGNFRLNVGNIENSTGVAIGKNVSVEVNQRQPERDELSVLLDAFILSLGRYGASLDDAQGVRKAAEAARAEVALPSPRWEAVRHKLTAIATAVSGVAALADAINNIQALVAHIVG